MSIGGRILFLCAISPLPRSPGVGRGSPTEEVNDDPIDAPRIDKEELDPMRAYGPVLCWSTTPPAAPTFQTLGVRG